MATFLAGRHTLPNFVIPSKVAAKCDRAAPIRRLGRLSREQISLELRQRVVALLCFRRGNIYDAELPDALLRAYLMVLDDDGKNSAQLLNAGLLLLLQTYILQRLMEGSTENDGWPLPSHANTLAVILFFLLSSQASIRNESAETSSALLQAFSPYTFAGFRYPCTIANTTNTSAVSKHGTGLLLHTQPRNIMYFGRPIALQLPPIACFAMLSYFARLEKRPTTIPSHLPTTREEANAAGRPGPTCDDMNYFNAKCRTKLTDSLPQSFPSVIKSRCHDPCWARATLLSNFRDSSRPPISFYEPGMLDGLWQGSYSAPYLETYSSWLANSAAPSSYEKFGRQPFYITLREYYCYSPLLPVPLDGVGDEQGEDAWLTSCHWSVSEHDGGIDVSDEQGSYAAHYAPIRSAHNTGVPIPDNTRFQDSRLLGALHVIVAGKTEGQHGDAWGTYSFIGHIKPSDGMITLLRDNSDPHTSGKGRSILQGYVISSQNFVGRWRHTCVEADASRWEAPFSLCKASLESFPSEPPLLDRRTTIHKYASYVLRSCSHWRDRMAGRFKLASSRYDTTPNFAGHNAIRQRTS